MSKPIPLRWPLLCAAIMCLANAFKPAVVDDTAYLWFVPAIIENPLHPYGEPPDGFPLIWYGYGQGAYTLLIPMVVPYWLAMGAALFSDELVVLKLWLFPFCLIFTLALTALLRRFASGYEKPLLVATALSPTFLPSLNVMIDVPSLALSLAAVATFMKSLDGSGRTLPALVIGTGLLAGLSAQTKYTGASSVAAILLCCLLRRRWLAGPVAAVIACAVFAGWEIYLAQVYGRSHFLLHLEEQKRWVDPIQPGLATTYFDRHFPELSATIDSKSKNVGPLIGELGGVTPAVSAMLLAGFRCRRRIVMSVVGIMLAGFALIFFVPNRWANLPLDPPNDDLQLTLSNMVAANLGALFLIMLVAASFYLGVRGWSRLRPRPRFGNQALLLIGWLLIEVVACLVISPFSAVRRVMGIVVVGTLLAGRLLSLTGRSPDRKRLITRLAGFSVGLGVLFAGTDFRDGLIEKRAVRDSLAWIRQQPGGDRPIWFTGHWGLQYYTDRAGMRAVYPIESTLEEGDWLIYPDTTLRVYGQIVNLQPEWAETVLTVAWQDRWPVRTIPDFYCGNQPLHHHEGPMLRLTIYRVKKPFLAQPPPPEPSKTPP